MMWFMRKLRTTAARGIVKITRSPPRERPRVVHRFVFHFGERFAGLGDVAVEEFDDFLRREVSFGDW